MPVLKQLARNLRNNPTEAENKLWWQLRGRQLNNMKFRRQQEIAGYLVDFVCFERRLIIEVDGDTHGQTENMLRDEERT